MVSFFRQIYLSIVLLDIENYSCNWFSKILSTNLAEVLTPSPVGGKVPFLRKGRMGG